jgi:hypothetical protein
LSAGGEEFKNLLNINQVKFAKRGARKTLHSQALKVPALLFSYSNLFDTAGCWRDEVICAFSYSDT